MRTAPMKVIYLAGPFRGPDHWAIWQNINRAAALALEVWKLGAACVCPHMNSFCFQGAAPDHVWLDGYLAILGKCDGILMTPDWQRSSGATAELRYAESHGLPVFLTLEDLAAWLSAQDEIAPIASHV